MSKESDYMLGMAHAIILKIRHFAITRPDPPLLELFEEDYQKLTSLVEKHYYPMEGKKDE